MCLAIPGQIESIHRQIAKINIRGLKREVNLMLVPEAKVGNYVLIHAGFAIQILDEKEAEETIQLLEQAEILS
ncbi:MAG: HypC/HybG/HupF family hydrogenase formation chaperone [Candidatus Edwardsbacteria bacterium]